MADAKTMNVKGTNYTIIDQVARDAATQASADAETNRKEFNGIYAGRNLNSLFSGQSDLYAYLGGLCDSGFGDLQIGDYFTVPVESSNLTVRIAGMDTYLNAMDTQLTQLHLVCRSHRNHRPGLADHGRPVPLLGGHREQSGHGGGEAPLPVQQPPQVGDRVAFPEAPAGAPQPHHRPPVPA